MAIALEPIMRGRSRWCNGGGDAILQQEPTPLHIPYADESQKNEKPTQCSLWEYLRQPDLR